MATFRILNQAPQYLLADGSVNAGGKLAFYETDLTTPKNTWSDPDMTVLNSNPVIMDAAGRSLTDIWGDGEYGAVMLDADDNVIWTRNDVRADGGASQQLPAPVAGEFLVGDGSQFVTTPIIQVPDPTGQAGKQLESDGALAFWATKATIPTLPTDGITDTPTSIRVGDTLLQWGSDTIPASGGFLSSKAVTFGTAFGGTPTFIGFQMGLGTNAFLMTNVDAQSTTGFTAAVSTVGAGSNITASQPFRWFAAGPAP